MTAALLGGCSTSNPLAGSSTPLAAAGGESGIGAVTKWSQAYARSPQDPRMALGYARALKAIGSKDQAFEVLKTAYRRDRDNGEIASELGRLALDMGRLDIAKASLQTAEAKGVSDWRTLSAQGTLQAKQGKHASAQQYYLAALKQEPDAVSVINNLALSYALDGKADKAAALLQKTVDSGKGDKRVRQNLALVLGLEGKFDEARNLASVDMPAENAQASMSYLRNMLSTPGNVAHLDGDHADAKPLQGEDWRPFAEEKEPTSNATAQVVPEVSRVSGPAQDAAAARVATLTPSQGGSTIVVKSPPKPKPQASSPAP
jgi:Flp pilus assembly protein TadD